jgi:hypothetical protein
MVQTWYRIWLQVYSTERVWIQQESTVASQICLRPTVCQTKGNIPLNFETWILVKRKENYLVFVEVSCSQGQCLSTCDAGIYLFTVAYTTLQIDHYSYAKSVTTCIEIIYVPPRLYKLRAWQAINDVSKQVSLIASSIEWWIIFFSMTHSFSLLQTRYPFNTNWRPMTSTLTFVTQLIILSRFFN